MTFNYILFNWDGTLADTLPIWLETYKQTSAHYNKIFTDEFIVTRLFGNWEGYKYFDADKEDFESTLFGKVKILMEKLELAEGAVELLKKVKHFKDILGLL